MLSRQQLAALMGALVSLSCNLAAPLAENHGGPAAAKTPVGSNALDSAGLDGPELVLDGTDIFDFTSFTLRPLGPSAAGEYGDEQRGSELTLKLSPAGGSWRVKRTHQEPGEPRDQATYTVELRNGSLLSPNGNVVIRGTKDGVLVLERTSGTISADYWVHYLRQK